MSKSFYKLFEVHYCLATVLFENDVDFSTRDLLKPLRSWSFSRGGFFHKL